MPTLPAHDVKAIDRNPTRWVRGEAVSSTALPPGQRPVGTWRGICSAPRPVALWQSGG